MKRRVAIVIVAVAVLGLILALVVRAHPTTDVVAGSVFITNIISEVADGRLEPRTLIRPGDCPGHHDVKPSDIRALSDSRALIIHNYQQNYAYVDKLVQSADNPDLAVIVIDIMGNWMAPPVQAEAVNKITQTLGEIDPENEAYYEEKAAQRVQAIVETGEEVQQRLADMEAEGVKVICGVMQAGFLNWAGFDIVATYGPEEFGTGEKSELVAKAREARVALVIDNLQSGEQGKSLAEDIGAVHVTLSNFPGGFPNTETWEKALDRNLDLLEEALNEWSDLYG